MTRGSLYQGKPGERGVALLVVLLTAVVVIQALT